MVTFAFEINFTGERLDKNAYQSVLSELEARESDLAIAAHLGQSLLEANEVLRQENAQILESFRQQIYVSTIISLDILIQTVRNWKTNEIFYAFVLTT